MAGASATAGGSAGAATHWCASAPSQQRMSALNNLSPRWRRTWALCASAGTAATTAATTLTGQGLHGRGVPRERGVFDDPSGGGGGRM